MPGLTSEKINSKFEGSEKMNADKLEKKQVSISLGNRRDEILLWPIYVKIWSVGR